MPAGTLPTDIAITPDGKAAFVSDPSSGNVFAVDLTTNTPGVSIGSRSGPAGIAIVRDQSPSPQDYSELHPGVYRFKVRAVSAPGLGSSVARYTWRITRN